LIIVDEVQRKMNLFPVLRPLIDKNRKPGRFLILGSAGPDLLRNSSETLAGRIAYHELFPLVWQEIKGLYKLDDLWFRGGFPDPFLKKDYWLEWMSNFSKTYFERDLPQLGFSADSIIGERLWSMIAHLHGNLVTYAELGRSLELSVHTIKHYLGFLQSAFLVRIIPPFHANIKKRLVKAPKVYIRDSGILHYLLGLDEIDQLYGHPKKGASWEGFVLEQVVNGLAPNRKIYFYRTHDGAELDLVITKGDKPAAAIEIKYGSDTRLSRGNTEAANTLGVEKRFMIVRGEEDYITSNHFRVCGLDVFLSRYINQL
jgi:predicted AAA+ superfamily ATPase